jgi:hypothetical protein
MPDKAALERILRALGREDRLALRAKYSDGGIAALRGELVFLLGRLNERSAAFEIEKSFRQLGRHRRLLLRHGIDLRKRPTVYSDEMIAGNVIPESIYPALTGKRPTISINGVAVHFVLVVMHELKIEYTAAGAVKAMQRYEVANRNRRLTAEQKNTPSKTKKGVADKQRTKNRVCQRVVHGQN